MSTTTTAQFLEGAVHHHHPLSPRGMSERLFTFWFNSFVYNQIWEDPRVDLKALALTPESRMLTISSGGCNVLNYLIHKPEHIHAVDLNRSHLCLLKLKLAAIEYLPSYDDFFLFFGCGDDELNRHNYFTYLAEHLDERTREFWEKGNWLRRAIFGPRIKYFTKNFYDYAKMGYFIRFLHTIARVGKYDPARLLSAKSRREQEEIFESNIAPFFDNWFVRATGKMPVMLYSLGIPPHQFSAMETETDGGLVAHVSRAGEAPGLRLSRSARIISAGRPSAAATTAPRACAMPEYLKEENFQALRDNLAPRLGDEHDADRAHALAAGQFARPLRLPRFAGLDEARADRRDVDRDRARGQARLAHRLPHRRHDLAGRDRAAARRSRPSSTTRKRSPARCCRKTAPPSTADSIFT